MSETPAPKRSRYLLWLVLAAVVIVAGYWYYRQLTLHPETDDAYLNANLVHLSAQVSGPIKTLYVNNHEHVEKGKLLLAIDPAPFAIAVQRAKAEVKLAKQNIGVDKAAVKASDALVAQRRAELVNAEKDKARILPLVKQGRIAPTRGDEVIRKAKVAQSALIAAINELHEAKEKLGDSDQGNADLMKARSALAKATLDLQHTRLYAPAAGYLDNVNVRVGSMATAQNPLFVLIEDGLWWVNANYKETQMQRIKPKQRANVHIDLYPDHVFHGYVGSISHGSGSAFSLLPPENATGNWVKVTQRFPVKVILIDPKPANALRVGASCQVTIDTTNMPSTTAVLRAVGAHSPHKG